MKYNWRSAKAKNPEYYECSSDKLRPALAKARRLWIRGLYTSGYYPPNEDGHRPAYTCDLCRVRPTSYAAALRHVNSSEHEEKVVLTRLSK
jgi:hypothetical protein